MLKLASFGLLGFLVVLMLPGNVVEQTPSFLYGAATIVAHDAYGNEIFSQTIHNQLFNQGEDLLINQTFADVGLALIGDDDQIGAICLSADLIPSTNEADTDVLFDLAHDNDDNVTATVITNCKTDVVTSASQVVTIGPLTFVAGNTDIVGNNWWEGDTVTNVGICAAENANVDRRGCEIAGTGYLFAVVDTSDVTLANTETVSVTYTFDISSAGT